MAFVRGVKYCKVNVGGMYTICNKRASHTATFYYQSEGGEASAPTSLCAFHAQLIISRGGVRVKLGSHNPIEISNVVSIAHSLPTGRKQK